MKIDIPVQRKTSVESNAWTPKQTTRTENEEQILWSGQTGGQQAIRPVAVRPTLNERSDRFLPETVQQPENQNETWSNFWSTRWNLIKLETHLPKDITNLLQAMIVQIYAKVLTFFHLNEGGFKTGQKRKLDPTSCSWEMDDLDDHRCIPTHHSKEKRARNQPKAKGSKRDSKSSIYGCLLKDVSLYVLPPYLVILSSSLILWFLVGLLPSSTCCDVWEYI